LQRCKKAAVQKSVLFLFRTRKYGVYCAKVLWWPGDICHRRNWLSGEAAGAEGGTVVRHNCAAVGEAWPQLAAKPV